MSLTRFRLAPKIGHLERMKRLSGIEPKNLIILTYQNKNMNGPGLSMEMSKKKSQRMYPNHWKEGNNHHIPRCQPTPQHCNRKLVHSCITLCQHHPNRLVLKGTSHCGDSNIWFRVCSCQNSSRTNYGPQKHTKISRCVPIMTKAYMVGDNKSVVTSSTIH